MSGVVRTSSVVFLLTMGFAVCAPSSVRAAAIQLNGVCQVGDCANPDTLPLDDALFLPFDFSYVFPNTDEYRVQGAVAASSTSSPLQWLIQMALAVTFVGNSTGGPSGDDVPVIDFLQNYENPIPGGSGTFFEFVNGGFADGPFAGASSVTSQLFVNNVALPLLGPFVPDDFFSATASNFPIGGLSDPLLVQDQFVVTFGAGTQPGATVVVANVPLAVPEPATVALLSAGAFTLAMKRRRAMR